MNALLILPAPAKINLRLEVLSRRADGYHELQMIMLRLELADEISFFEAATLSMSCDDPTLPLDSSNLVMKAALLFQERAGIACLNRIHLSKKVPSAAGLGGGSSDAAATLVGLNALHKAGLPESELERMALKLGADVPFFIRKGHKIARGIGEILFPLNLAQELNLVLVNPGHGVSTAEVYRKIQLTSLGNHHNLPASLRDLSEVVRLLRNDLEPVVAADFPVITEMKRFLLKAGSIGCMMSGSGPTVFGIFEDAQAANRAAKNAREKGWKAWATRTRSE